MTRPSQQSNSVIRESLPHRDELPHTAGSLLISGAMQKLASCIAWIWLALMIVIVANVTLRYVFGEGRVEFEEIQWHLYAIGFLLGLSTCLTTDDHIRVDVFHERLSLTQRSWIELYGLLLLFFPFVLMVLWYSFSFVQFSFSVSEISDAPGGLPYRWAIKGMLSVSMAILLIAGFGRLLRVSCYLFGLPQSIEPQGPDAR